MEIPKWLTLGIPFGESPTKIAALTTFSFFFFFFFKLKSPSGLYIQYLCNNTPFIGDWNTQGSFYLQLQMGLHNPIWQIDTSDRSDKFFNYLT